MYWILCGRLFHICSVMQNAFPIVIKFFCSAVGSIHHKKERRVQVAWIESEKKSMEIGDGELGMRLQVMSAEGARMAAKKRK